MTERRVIGDAPGPELTYPIRLLAPGNEPLDILSARELNHLVIACTHPVTGHAVIAAGVLHEVCSLCFTAPYGGKWEPSRVAPPPAQQRQAVTTDAGEGLPPAFTPQALAPAFRRRKPLWVYAARCAGVLGIGLFWGAVLMVAFR